MTHTTRQNVAESAKTQADEASKAAERQPLQLRLIEERFANCQKRVDTAGRMQKVLAIGPTQRTNLIRKPDACEEGHRSRGQSRRGSGKSQGSRR